MPNTNYQVTYLMELAVGDQYGVRAEDIPKGMERVGRQSDWLQSSPEGLAVHASLKANGFDIADVGDDPVFKQKQKIGTVIWLPYSRWYEWRNAHYHAHYIPLTVKPAPLTSEEVAAQLEESKAAHVTELEKHKAEQAAALDKMRGDLELQKAKLQGELELQQMRREMEQLQMQASGGTMPSVPMPNIPMPGSAAGIRTYEVFGLLNNQRVPLAQVALNQGGRFVQVPGSRILVGDSPGDGFGLAGIPGAWGTLYPGQSPASFGLDPDKAVVGHDGVRGWVLPAQFLMQMFGSNWRSQIYGL